MGELLAGKVVLVTGGGSGIGRAAALGLARAGARVVVADLDETAGAQTAAGIAAAGGEAEFLAVDVCKAPAVEELVRHVAAAHGRLDCAFNNAGIMRGFGKRLAETTEAEWDAMVDTNLKAVWLCMKYEIVQMLHQGGGSIVNTASAAGLMGTPRNAIYSAAKHGVVGLTRSVALQYVDKGIRVNAICPGVVETPMVAAMDAELEKLPDAPAGKPLPPGRRATPEEVAEAVVWLCSDKASYVTAAAMAVDGGWSAG